MHLFWIGRLTTVFYRYGWVRIGTDLKKTFDHASYASHKSLLSQVSHLSSKK